MSLKINDTTRKILRITGIVLVVLLIACVIRVIIWEHFYYAEKEGSPRHTIEAPSLTQDNEEPVDETEVTPVAVAEYKVAADKPRYLSIEKLGVTNARIREVAADPGQRMGVPASIFDVGWARTSSKPGQGGTLLMDGHNGGPTKDGVFKRLPELKPGDIITIERGDGQIFRYAVHDIEILKTDEANAYMRTMQQSPITGRESLSLITCTGDWIQAARTYDSRAMLRATRI